jgi:catechol 2,3-dioxygenase
MAMHVPAVSGIGSVAIDVTDLAAAEAFFCGPAGLAVVEREEHAGFLRGSGRKHHILALHEGRRRAIRRVEFVAGSRTVVDKIRSRVAAEGLQTTPARPVAGPGGGYGFGFQDPEGRNFAVLCGRNNHPRVLDRPDSPQKIAHVNLNSGDRDATTRVLIECLGFRLIDETAINRFFCCGPDHHSVVVGGLGVPTLNHIAFEMADLDAMMRGAGRMRDAGHPIEWGVGRHGPGNNAFAYFIGPEDLPLEFTSEVLQVDESYAPRGPKDWQWPAGRLDQWGISDPPSARWRRVQYIVEFATCGWHLRH